MSGAVSHGGHDFVRPFIMTGGRTRTDRRDLRIETMLQATIDTAPEELPSEQAAILALCHEPLSVAELAAALGLVVGVVTVVAGDLITAGLLDVHHTDPVDIELDMLTRMIERVPARDLTEERAEVEVHAAPEQRTITRVTPVKFVIAGGFGVGKTTFVGAISEIEPLRTEAAMTTLSDGVDDVTHIRGKTTTTVAMDFGRITVDPTLVMYLFGTPGQDRFGFMWDDICTGALGAVVLVDTRRVEQSFPPVDYFEAKRVPFVVGVNRFDGAPRYPLAEVREALGVHPIVPVVECDARNRASVKFVLLTLLESLVGHVKVRDGG